MTGPNILWAQSFASRLVKEKLAACVNIFPHMTSIYQWDGEIESSDECVLIIKTQSAHIETIKQLTAQDHPYDLPAFIVLNIDRDASDGSFLNWISLQTSIQRSGE